MSVRRSCSISESAASSLDASSPRDRKRISTSGKRSLRYAGSSMPHAIPPTGSLRYDGRSEAIPVASPVRKAVFPAAGLGTRFLPATKAQPKEMLPLVDKPIIQYGVEEATAAGVDDIIIVTGRGKNAIEDHFDVSIELETFLESRGKRE